MIEIRPRGYKTFFILSSAELKFQMLISMKISTNSAFFQAQISLEYYFFLLRNVKMATIVGILTFMSMKNFMLS